MNMNTLRVVYIACVDDIDDDETQLNVVTLINECITRDDVHCMYVDNEASNEHIIMSHDHAIINQLIALNNEHATIVECHNCIP